MTTPDGRLTVLLAEDDENDLILLRRALSKLGILRDCISVSNGEEARAYLRGEGKYSDRREFPPADLLIVDHRMPRLSGMDVLVWLRRQPRFDRLPVVVCSLFVPGQKEAVERLNAASCIKSGESSELQLALAEAIIGAFRTASLVPDSAWYRTSSHPPLPRGEAQPVLAD